MSAAGPFVPFTLPHLVPVAVILVLAAALAAWGRRQSASTARAAGRVLAVVLVVYYVAESIFRVSVLDVRPMQLLPFELCNALFFIGAWALWSGNERAFEVMYFWTFAGTLHSVLTPTPSSAFPGLGYFQYFCAHGLLILSAVYAAAVLRQVPRSGSLRRAFLALQAFTLLAAVVDWLTGANSERSPLRPLPSMPSAPGPGTCWEESSSRCCHCCSGTRPSRSPDGETVVDVFVTNDTPISV